MATQELSLKLSEKEARLLVQALDHCLETCQRKSKGGDGPCEDCEAARALHGRLDLLVQRPAPRA